MGNLVWRYFVGQERIKQVLSAAFQGNTLGHAYLMCGQEGVGTFQAAVELGMALLCTSENAPCYECSSCRKISKHAHPDFHLLFPAALGSEHKSSDGKLNERGWEYLSDLSQARLASPYEEGSSGKGVPIIPVDLVRSLNHAVIRGPVDGNRCVVIIDGIEEMGNESANAMLKVLEEPPAGTFMILLTSRPSMVLPTIRSRCQVLRFGILSPEVLDEALARMAPECEASSRRWAVHAAMGSLGKALTLTRNPNPEAQEFAQRIWRMAAENSWDGLMEALDEVSTQVEYSYFEEFFLQSIHMVREGLIGKITPPEKYICSIQPPSLWVEKLDVPQALRLARLCEHALSALKSHGNTKLILVHFMLSIVEILHGKE